MFIPMAIKTAVLVGLAATGVSRGFLICFDQPLDLKIMKVD